MEEEKPPAGPRKRMKASTVTPPPPPDPWAIWKREAMVVCLISFSVVSVVMFRRWVTLATGGGTLAGEILSGSLPLADLMSRIEKGVETYAAPAVPTHKGG